MATKKESRELVLASTTAEVKYIFKIPEELKCTPAGSEIEIVFVNGIFSRCSFPGSGYYSRKQWKLLSLIENVISQIEDSIESGTGKFKL